MKRLKSAAAIGLFLASLGGPAAPQVPENAMRDLVAGLQRLQVKVALGDAGAPAEEAKQLAAIDRAIAAAPPEYWRTTGGQAEAAIFIFGGGQPRSVSRLLDANLIPPDRQGMLRGAVAYALGRENDAETLLGSIDPKALDARLAGQFAYVAAVIAARHNPEKSIDLLDLARVLSPATLVEEASLRRETLFLASRGATERTAGLAKTYFARFSASPYASRFTMDLATAVEGYGVIHGKGELEEFADAARAMPLTMRKGFLLGVARGELLRGKFSLASDAADFLLPDTELDSADESRRLLYASPANLFEADFELGNDEFAKVNPDRLGREDHAIYMALS
jgi:chemotaxis protein MotC